MEMFFFVEEIGYENVNKCALGALFKDFK